MAKPGTARGRCPACGLICYTPKTPWHACVSGGRCGQVLAPLDADPVELRRAALRKLLVELPAGAPVIAVEVKDNLVHVTIDQPLACAELEPLIASLQKAKRSIEAESIRAAKEAGIAREIAQFRRRHLDAIELPGGALWSPSKFRGMGSDGRYITSEKVPAGSVPEVMVRASGGRTAHRWNGGPRCLCCKDYYFLYRPELAKDGLPMRKGAS